MSCCNNGQLRDRFPIVETLVFFTQDSEKLPSINSNLEAHLTGLNKVSDAPLLRRLQLLTDINLFTQWGQVFLDSIEFIGFDFSDTDNFGVPLFDIWQPNFFNPLVKINNADLTRSSAGGLPVIGVTLPYCLSLNRVINSPQDIKIFASLARMIKEDGQMKYNNYPLQAIMRIYHK